MKKVEFKLYFKLCIKNIVCSWPLADCTICTNLFHLRNRMEGSIYQRRLFRNAHIACTRDSHSQLAHCMPNIHRRKYNSIMIMARFSHIITILLCWRHRSDNMKLKLKVKKHTRLDNGESIQKMGHQCKRRFLCTWCKHVHHWH